MKKWFAFLLIISLLLTTAGCAAAGHALDRAEDRVEEKLDAAEDSVERAVRKAVTPAQVSKPVPADSGTDIAAAADPVTKEGAEEIALKYLGLTRDQVKRLHTEYEIDDGVGQYDVGFISGDFEYEFEIHGETGNILSYDREHKYD